LIVRKAYIMENTQSMKTKTGSESKVDTSDDSIKSRLVADSESKESTSSSPSTNASTPKGSIKTWKSAELAELKLRAGLVAGALSDFQGAKGVVTTKEVTYTAPSGRTCKAIKVILIVPDADLVAEDTPDGLDFNLVVEPSGT
jgi:hypothetical protein